MFTWLSCWHPVADAHLRSNEIARSGHPGPPCPVHVVAHHWSLQAKSIVSPSHVRLGGARLSIWSRSMIGN